MGKENQLMPRQDLREKNQEQLIEIGNTIRLKRKIKNMSGKELAEVCGVSTNFISEVERGLKNCSDEVLRSIAKYLELDELDIFTKLNRVPLSVQEELINHSELTEAVYIFSQSDDENTKESLYNDFKAQASHVVKGNE
jgi:transcriptional regulator with XRE-family HTH domain